MSGVTTPWPADYTPITRRQPIFERALAIVKC